MAISRRKPELPFERLHALASSAGQVFRAVESYLRRPNRAKGLEAQDGARIGVDDGDIPLARNLAGLGSLGGRIVEEAARFGHPADSRILEQAGLAVLGVAGLAESLDLLARGPGQVDGALLGVKRTAAEMERLNRIAVGEAVNGKKTVDGLKARELLRRFSETADYIDRIADEIGDILVK